MMCREFLALCKAVFKSLARPIGTQYGEKRKLYF